MSIEDHFGSELVFFRFFHLTIDDKNGVMVYMPVRVTNAPKMAPSLTQEANLFGRMETGPHRVTGPSKSLAQLDHNSSLITRVKAELTPLARQIHTAMENGRGVSLYSTEVFGLIDKLEENGGTGTLTPQELGVVWATVKEARGESVKQKDASGSEVDINIGGVSDSESVYYIADKTARKQADANLGSLQEDIEMYLTGQEKKVGTREVSKFGFTFRKWGREKATKDWGPTIKIPDESATRAETAEAARSVYKGENDYRVELDRIAKDRFNGREWKNLSIAEMREVRAQALENTQRAQGSRRVAEHLNRISNSLDVDLVKGARESANPQDKELARIADQMEEIRERLLREGQRIDRMQSVDEWLLLLGVDTSNPNHRGILSANDVGRAVVRYYGLIGADAEKVMRDPNKEAFRYIQASSADGAIFAGELVAEKLNNRKLEGKFNVPEQLKKSDPKPSAKLTESLSGEDAAYALLRKFGAGEISTNPADYLKTKFGLTDEQAVNLLDQARGSGLMVIDRAQQKNGPSTYKFKVDINFLGSWGKPEMLVEAVHRGWIQEANLQNHLETALRGQYQGAELKNEVQRRIAEYKRLRVATDNKANNQDRMRSAEAWDPKQLALLMLLGGVGVIPPSVMPYEQQQDTAEYLV